MRRASYSEVLEISSSNLVKNVPISGNLPLAGANSTCALALRARSSFLISMSLAKRERELRQQTNTKVKDAERKRDAEIKDKQESIQNMSVFLPPIPLLVIAFFVYRKKRSAENQGATASRVLS